MKHQFTISEFAKLMNTTKDTLIHYDHINIFKPEYRLDNGYRMYAARQATSFLMIQAYRDVGYSLKEIQAILSLQHPYENYKKSLIDSIDETMKRLMHTKNMLHIRDYYENISEDLVMNHLSIRQWDLSSFHVYDKPLSDDNFFERLADAQNTDTIDGLSWMLGVCFNSQTNQSFLFSPSIQTLSDYPSGKVVVSKVLGDFDDIAALITRFTAQCLKEGISIDPNIYALQITDEIHKGPHYTSTFLIISALTS